MSLIEVFRDFSLLEIDNASHFDLILEQFFLVHAHGPLLLLLLQVAHVWQFVPLQLLAYYAVLRLGFECCVDIDILLLIYSPLQFDEHILPYVLQLDLPEFLALLHYCFGLLFYELLRNAINAQAQNRRWSPVYGSRI